MASFLDNSSQNPNLHTLFLHHTWATVNRGVNIKCERTEKNAWRAVNVYFRCCYALLPSLIDRVNDLEGYPWSLLTVREAAHALCGAAQGAEAALGRRRGAEVG